jgi:hypothetical protein
MSMARAMIAQRKRARSICVRYGLGAPVAIAPASIRRRIRRELKARHQGKARPLRLLERAAAASKPAIAL